MFKFLHAADLHLDSRLHGLDRYEGAPVEAIRDATRRAVKNLVALAVAERVDFVLIAGDVYDGDWTDFNTGLFFARQMTQLRNAGIAVYLLAGNHDAASVISRSLTLPENVRGFGVDRPHSLTDAATGAVIHGQGFATKAVTRDLSADYPAADPRGFNIGVLHTSAAGCEGHEPYAPCTVEGLARLGYDYWALGHVHVRQTLREVGPTVAYPGNTQGRHARETGPKGCLLVTVEGTAVATEFRPLDVFRWETCLTDAAGCRTADDVIARVAPRLRTVAVEAEGRPVAVRVEVTGRSEAHATLSGNPLAWEAEVRAAAMREAGDMLWIEKVRVRTTPPSLAADQLADGPLADIRRHVEQVAGDDSQLADLAAELDDLWSKLPHEVRTAVAPAGFADPAWLRPLARQSGDLLLAKLVEAG